MSSTHLTVAAVVEQQSRFLFVEELVNGAKVINQPAGHVEPGESLTAAVIREVHEETAWEFKPEYIVGVYLWTHPENGERFLRVAYCGTVANHDPALPLDEGVLRTLWLSREELLHRADMQRSPMVPLAIEDFLAGARFPLAMFRQIDLDQLTDQAQVVGL